MTANAEAGLPLPQRAWAILAISLGTALLVIDNTIITVALPTIAEDLGASGSTAVMLVTLYQLILLMTLMPFSALGDLIGHRRLYGLGQIVFLAATLICVAAPSLPVLLLGRALQALGAAAALSMNAAILRRIYPANRLGRGLGLNSIIIACASAFAPTFGGLILAATEWRWVFAAAAPFALLSLLMSRVLPTTTPVRRDYDVGGALMYALVCGLFLAGIETHVHGGPAIGALALGLAAAALCVVFVQRERAKANPILPVDLLGVTRFALPTIAAMASFMGSMTLLLSLPFRLDAAGFAPEQIGVLISSWPLAMMATSALAGLLADYTRPGLLGVLGMTLCLIGFCALALLPEAPSVADIIWRLAVSGAGVGLFLSPNSHQIVGAAPPHRLAAAGALLSTTRLTGQTLGAALFGALMAAGWGLGAAPALAAAMFALIAGLCSLAVLLLKR